MKLIFWSGWSAVLLFAIVTLRADAHTTAIWLDWLLIALCGLATLCLYRKPSFPRRSLGLAVSWGGPFLILLWRVSYLFLNSFISGSAAAEANSHLLSYAVSGMFFLKGCVSGLLMFWLFRGYGMIAFAASAATFWPHPLELGQFQTKSFAATMEQAAIGYPYSWWWFPALCAAIPSWAGGIYFTWTIRQMERLLS